MKKQILRLFTIVTLIVTPAVVFAQATDQHMVNVQKWRTKYNPNGTVRERDSLVAIYVDNVVKKNDKILSHREYAHWFTEDNRDYIIIDEFKDYAAMEEANKLYDELEKKAWPDEKKRKDYFAALDAYFENWHGDGLYRMNPALSK